jgi:predicted permease
LFEHVISIVAPLFLIVGVGYFYGARVRPEMRITNQLIMDVFMPALIFSVMIRDDFYPGQYLYLMLGGALVMLGSGVLAYLLARSLGFNWRSFVPSAMFSNWANLGIPLYVFTLGDLALGGGIMLVVVGNVLCFTIGTYIYSGKLSGFDVVKTPIIVAVILGGLINFSPISVPQILSQPIDMLGQVVIPLMLFSLGVRLTHVSWSDSAVGVVMACFCPIVGVSLAMLLVHVLPLSNLHANILVLFGVLPPAVINFMLAEQYQNDPEKVASMVLIGNLVSLISIPLVLFLVLSKPLV